jgi:hypothetical protein
MRSSGVFVLVTFAVAVSACAVDPGGGQSPGDEGQETAAILLPNPGNPNPCGGSPYACADGLFKAWNGNTGASCSWSGNASSLGACANKDYLIQNTGFQCAGCDYIRLYWGAGFTGPYFCVPPGFTYGQATSPNLRFDKGSGTGLGDTIWFNAASAKWSGPC